MAEAARPRSSFLGYIAMEEASEQKHGFFDGAILAMAGGPAHAQLQARALWLLGGQLDGSPCTPYSSDLRVRVQATGLGTYPDLTVLCAPLVPDPQDRNTATNPTLLVEVLSPTTERYDRGETFDHYQQIRSLREYVLISSRHPRVEVFHRNEDGSWRYTRAGPGEVAELVSIGARVAVDTLYQGVPLDEAEDVRSDPRR